MEVKKSRKLLLTVILVVAVLVIGITALIFARGAINSSEEKKALNEGDKYLADMNYSKAIIAYGEALGINPDNVSALIGLANAYYKDGDIQAAKSIFTEQLADVKSTEAWRTYAEILIEEGSPEEALEYIEKLINEDSEEEDYKWEEEVIAQAVTELHPYDDGINSSVYTDGGKVYTKGSNVLGTLGTGKNLAKWDSTDAFTVSDLSVTAKNVYSAGYLTAAVTESGELYLSGSNRSGQMGLGYATLLADGSWQQAGISNVAKVCGTSSTLFVLTKSGSLYCSGVDMSNANRGQTTYSFKKISSFGKIIDVQSDPASDMVAILTADQRLYTGNGAYENSWLVASKNATKMSIANGAYVYVAANRTIGGTHSVALPSLWGYSDGWNYETVVPYEVKAVALFNNSLYLLDYNGSLVAVRDGMENSILEDKKVTDIYCTGRNLVAVLSDGSYLLLDESGNIQ